jgi:hypothetical protein
MERGKPRTSYFMGSKSEPWYESYGTWVEAEDICYPQGGFIRRAKVLHPDGKLRILRTSIADTYYSLPVTPNTGYITRHELKDGRGVWVFVKYKSEEEEWIPIEQWVPKAIEKWKENYDSRRD